MKLSTSTFALGFFFSFVYLPLSSAAHSITKRRASPILDMIFGNRKRLLKPKLYYLHKPPMPVIRHKPHWSGNSLYGGHLQMYSPHSPYLVPSVGPITHNYNSFTPHKVHLDFEAPDWIEAEEYGSPHSEEHIAFEPYGPFEEEEHGHQHILEDHVPEIPLQTYSPPPQQHTQSHISQHNDIQTGSYPFSPPQHHLQGHVPHNNNDVHPSSHHSSNPLEHPNSHVSIHHNDAPHNSHHAPPPTKYQSSHKDFRPSVLLNEIHEGGFKPIKINSVLKRPPQKHFHHHTHMHQNHPNKHLRDITTKAIYREDYPKKDVLALKDRVRPTLVSGGIKGLDHNVLALIRNHAKLHLFPR